MPPRLGSCVAKSTEFVDDSTSLPEREGAERIGLLTDVLESWRPRVAALFTRLDQAREASPLPEEPTNGGELLAWLLDLRRARLQVVC